MCLFPFIVLIAVFVCYSGITAVAVILGVIFLVFLARMMKKAYRG